MNAHTNQENVPLNMRYLIIAASFLCLPDLVAEQRISNEKEIMCSFVGYMCGPYFALIPLSYKLRFMLGSAVGVIPLFLSSYLRAFSLGLITSYYRLVADLFCCALCIRTPKSTVLIMSSLVSSWIGFTTFFSLHFCPSLAAFVCTPFFTFIFALVGIAVSYAYIIETPEEIFQRFKHSSSKSAVYEELYDCISYINGRRNSTVEEFREEYKMFLDEKSQIKESFTLRERIYSIFLSVNISFIYIAIQRAAGVENRHSLDRIFLGAMQLFSWSFKYADSPKTYFSVIIPPVALYFVCVSTNNTQDIFLVFIMLLGVAFVPKSVKGYSLNPPEIAFSRSIQHFFVLLTFIFIMQTGTM